MPETNSTVLSQSSGTFISPEMLALVTKWGLNVITAVLILIGGWLIAGWLATFVEKRSERTGRIDRTLSVVLGKIVRAAILILTLIAVLDRFGVQTASLVAVLGAAGLAIGLALQGALSNVAAGVMLLAFRPFKIGDVIDFGNTGVVDEIGLFVTKMHTGDNVAMIVPNSKIWGSVILNYAQLDNRRIDMVFGIGYGDSIEKAIRIINEVLATDPRILKDPAPLVAVGELGESSVNLWVRPWVKRADYLDTKLALTRQVKEKFDAQGVTIPFPQRAVHLHNVAPAA